MKTMTWLKIKFAVGVSVVTLLAGGAATIAFSQSSPTVYSLLEKPPIIANAVFEREINMKMMPADLPAGAQKQTFTFSLDGEDYRMDFGGGMVGKFGDVFWQTMGGQLTKFEARMNRVDGNSGGITASGDVARMGINSLITSGITTQKPKNIAWESGHKKMTFEGEDGKKYAVEFMEENSLPVSAIIRDSSTGVADGVVVYRYDPSLFEGRLPVEITRYYGSVADEKAKSFVLRIQTLKTSSSHLSSSILNPDKFATTNNPNYMPLFYSNNIPYWTDAKGKARRVLTAEENAAEVEKILRKQKK